MHGMVSKAVIHAVASKAIIHEVRSIRYLQLKATSGA